MNAWRVYSAKTDRTTGVICDQAVRRNGFYVSKDYPEHLRRTRFKDPESGKTLVFLTNYTTLPPLTIASLYTLLQILSVSVFEKTLISCALQPDDTRTITAPINNKLNLFDI